MVYIALGSIYQVMYLLINKLYIISFHAKILDSVLTKDHTRSSLAMWGMIMQSKTGDLFHRTVQAAVNSVLCHHSGVPFGEILSVWAQLWQQNKLDIFNFHILQRFIDMVRQD